MKNYRIIKDSFLGYEAQVRYSWFPFIWFQMGDFFWINTWPTPEYAKQFIQQKKSGKYAGIEINSSYSNSEYEREVKLLVFQPKNFLPEVIWEDNETQREQNAKRRWWPVINTVNG